MLKMPSASTAYTAIFFHSPLPATLLQYSGLAARA
jgi:hypothetical protein